jgi:hypothetical protein
MLLPRRCQGGACCLGQPAEAGAAATHPCGCLCSPPTTPIFGSPRRAPAFLHPGKRAPSAGRTAAWLPQCGPLVPPRLCRHPGRGAGDAAGAAAIHPHLRTSLPVGGCTACGLPRVANPRRGRHACGGPSRCLLGSGAASASRLPLRVRQPACLCPKPGSFGCQPHCAAQPRAGRRQPRRRGVHGFSLRAAGRVVGADHNQPRLAFCCRGTGCPAAGTQAGTLHSVRCCRRDVRTQPFPSLSCAMSRAASQQLETPGNFLLIRSHLHSKPMFVYTSRNPDPRFTVTLPVSYIKNHAYIHILFLRPYSPSVT